MLAMYLKIVLRALLRSKLYAAINVVGLAVGISCCILIMIFVENEVSYDRYHRNADRIYRFVADLEIQGSIATPSSVAAPEGPALVSEFPEIDRMVRFFSPNIFGQPVLSHDDRHFRESGFRYADSTVFEVFTLPFIEGDPGNALNQPNTIVLAHSVAKKYFGNESPMNKTLLLDGRLPLKVTGVMEDLPENTHLNFTMLASMGTLEAIHPLLMSAWNSPLMHTYLLLQTGNDARALGAKFPAFAEKYIGQNYFPRTYGLEPLVDIQLRSGRGASMKPAGDINNVYVFSAIGAFILLLACINFMNLSTARSLQRAKEVGMRKALGAQRNQIALQFIGESLLMTLMATSVAMGLTALVRAAFESITGRPLLLLVAPWWEALVVLMGLTLVVGLVAGSYPALVLSRFSPLEMFRIGKMRQGGGMRKGLVVFQFATSVTLMICTVVVHSQLEYVRNAKLGFDKEHIVIIPLGVSEAGRQIEAMKTALTSSKEVAGVTASFGVAGIGIPGMDYWRDGMEPDKIVNVATLLTDQDFMSTYGIQLKEGRFFSREFGSDAEKAFVINETAAKSFGWENPIGKRIQWKQPTGSGYATLKDGVVIGVVGDFHYSTLQNQIQPLVLHMWPDWQAFNTLAIRIRPGDFAGTMSRIEETLKRFVPSLPVDWYFLDVSMNQAYQNIERFGKIFMSFSTIAIVVACLGLFALASCTAQQRTKEIGIRKVLGATAVSVVGLLSREFIGLVAVANVVAWPLAYYAMNLWLEDFAYRVEIGWWVFALAGGAALLIALLTVSFRAIRAARTNPVEALRYE